MFVYIDASRNFRRGGGGKPKKSLYPTKTKKAPHMDKKVTKRPSHGEKVPHKEKNVAKRLPQTYISYICPRPPCWRPK